MFSLIITIISIALVAALALATIYYGGDAFTKGGDAAKASQLINEGQQLQGARTLMKADAKISAGKTVANLTSESYLAQAPVGWDASTDLSTGTEFVTNGTALSDAVCKVVNSKAGLGEVTFADAAARTAVATKSVYDCVAGQVHYRF